QKGVFLNERILLINKSLLSAHGDFLNVEQKKQNKKTKSHSIFITIRISNIVLSAMHCSTNVISASTVPYKPNRLAEHAPSCLTFTNHTGIMLNLQLPVDQQNSRPRNNSKINLDNSKLTLGKFSDSSLDIVGKQSLDITYTLLYSERINNKLSQDQKSYFLQKSKIEKLERPLRGQSIEQVKIYRYLPAQIVFQASESRNTHLDYVEDFVLGRFEFPLDLDFYLKRDHGVGLNHRNAKWKISTFCRKKKEMPFENSTIL
ncbi:hypothetical protein L345_10355, partial [Ophiophagus hannah]